MSEKQTIEAGNSLPPPLGSALLSAELNRCGSCVNFRRLKWHESVVKGGGWQLGGLCQMLSLALEGENSGISSNGVYVMQSFGCMYWKQNKEVSCGRSTSAELAGSEGDG